jgi:hypothetical protein
MVTTTRKINEKGQRTPRSMNSYSEKGGTSEAAICACGAVFSNKHWHHNKNSKNEKFTKMIVCPACRRIREHNPAGIVALRGSFLVEHAAEINNLINNIEQSSVERNPLCRVMETNLEKQGLVITTTDGKLAQKIGREVYKSHGGELHMLWNHSEDLVRVNWTRQG